MWKEVIICGVIIITILIGNQITQNYSVETIEELTKELEELKQEMHQEQENIDFERTNEKIDNIFKQWNERHDKLAYYIEHDELEKVETNLTSLKSYIESNEYAEAVSELDKSVFVLKHIEDKYVFNLQNAF